MTSITSTLALDRLASIQAQRYPISPRFNGAVQIKEPSTCNIIELCDTVKHMCLSRPQYLPEDTSDLYSTLLSMTMSLKQSFDRRMMEEEKLAQQDDARAHCVTKVRRIPMGQSGKVPDYTEEELLKEIKRREALLEEESS